MGRLPRHEATHPYPHETAKSLIFCGRYDARMRTRVTLDPDVEALVKAAMVEQHLTFKEALNQAITAGLAPKRREPFRQRTFDLGFRPDIANDKALQLASAVQGEEVVRRPSFGK